MRWRERAEVYMLFAILWTQDGSSLHEKDLQDIFIHDVSADIHACGIVRESETPTVSGIERWTKSDEVTTRNDHRDKRIRKERAERSSAWAEKRDADRSMVTEGHRASRTYPQGLASGILKGILDALQTSSFGLAHVEDG